jgi:GPH family glycoside/pentoside/hexuronide:cation symporter
MPPKLLVKKGHGERDAIVDGRDFGDRARDRPAAGAQRGRRVSAALPLRLKLFHGLGSVAYGVKDNGFSTFLLIFYSQVVGLDAWLVSVALMCALVADAFVDPLIGHFSDRTYTRWGRRHPWLYLAPIPLACSWMLLWSPPADHTHIFAYLVAVAILVRTLVSACEVPSQSLVAELTSDYDERTVLTRYRFLFAWFGGLILYFLANTVFLRADAEHAVGQLNPDGYWQYGLCGAIVMAVTVLVSAAGQHSRLAHLPATKPLPTSTLHALGEIWQALRHPAAVILLGGAFVGIMGNQLSYTLSNYLYLYVWQFDETGFALLPFMLLFSVTAAFLLAQPLSRRFGKRQTAIVCGLVGVVFWVAPFQLRLAGVWPAAGTMLSTGLLIAFILGSNVNAVIVQICAQSMLADVVEASQVETGRRTEGVLTAGWMFVQKCATAVGIGLTGVLVSWSGIPTKATPGKVPSAVIDTLTIAYSLIAVSIVVVSALIFRRFPITREDHAARLAALDAAARIDPDAEGLHP